MKIEIDIRDGIEPTTALSLVKRVVEGGRISTSRGKPIYCLYTCFVDGLTRINVCTNEYRKNDCFVVCLDNDTGAEE